MLQRSYAHLREAIRQECPPALAYRGDLARDALSRPVLTRTNFFRAAIAAERVPWAAHSSSRMHELGRQGR
jgi:hypothetical protein